MPKIIDNSPPDNWLAEHAASLDALCAATPARPPPEPYPGEHPCEIAGCAANAPFGLAALPRRVWFCRQHWEEIQCQMSSTPSTTTASESSKPEASSAPTYGFRSISPQSAVMRRLVKLYGDKSEPSQLTLPI